MFKTSADGEHIGDDYFLGSNDKVDPYSSPCSTSFDRRQIRYFLEPSSLSSATETSPAKLVVPAERSINRIGHALAILDPVFRRHTLESDKIRDLAKEVGEHESPRVLQSMIICKQPRIGGIGESPSCGKSC